MYGQGLREPKPEEVTYIKTQMRAYMRKTGICVSGIVTERVALNVRNHHGDIDRNVSYGRLCSIIRELCPSIQRELEFEGVKFSKK
jgi:hypothetical protein